MNDDKLFEEFEKEVRNFQNPKLAQQLKEAVAKARDGIREAVEISDKSGLPFQLNRDTYLPEGFAKHLIDVTSQKKYVKDKYELLESLGDFSYFDGYGEVYSGFRVWDSSNC